MVVVCQMYVDVIEYVLGQFLVIVYGDLSGVVFECWIVEVGDEIVGIGQQINVGNGQCWSLFVKYQLVGGVVEDVILYVVVNVCMFCQIVKSGEERVVVVEYLQFYLFSG